MDEGYGWLNIHETVNSHSKQSNAFINHLISYTRLQLHYGQSLGVISKGFAAIKKQSFFAWSFEKTKEPKK